MAYGLTITNPSGHIAIDSEYQGIYYLGKKSHTSGINSYQIPSYDDSTTPPLTFIRPHTANSSDYVAVEKLAKDSGVAPGGVDASSVTFNGVSLASVTDTYHIFWNGTKPGSSSSNNPYVSQTRCEAGGGTWFSGDSGSYMACRRTTPLSISSDRYNRSNNNHYHYSSNGETTNYVQISLEFDSNGLPDSHSIEVSGYGWSTSGSPSGGDTNATLGNNVTFIDGSDHENAEEGSNVTGFLPYSDSLGRFHPEAMATLTCSGLSTGWSLNTRSSGAYTVYAFGIGGAQVDSEGYGLELRNSSGDITFSSHRPPPSIRGIQTVSISSATIEAGQTGSVSGSYPMASTAYNALPVFPRCVVGGTFDFYNGGNWYVRFYPKEALFGFKYGIDGSSNITSMDVMREEIDSTTQAGGDYGPFPDPGAAGSAGTSTLGTMTINSAVPSWDQTSGSSTTAVGSASSIQSTGYNVEGTVMFLDTTLFDTLTY